MKATDTASYRMLSTADGFVDVVVLHDIVGLLSPNVNQQSRVMAPEATTRLPGG